MGRWSVHPLRANSLGSASKSMLAHSSSSSKLPLLSFESLAPAPRRNEKDPDRDRPTMASRPEAVTGFELSRMFWTTFVRFLVPLNEMMCVFVVWLVATNTRCCTRSRSITVTSSRVVAKNSRIVSGSSPLRTAMRANLRSSSNVSTTGRGGCVSARDLLLNFLTFAATLSAKSSAAPVKPSRTASLASIAERRKSSNRLLTGPALPPRSGSSPSIAPPEKAEKVSASPVLGLRGRVERMDPSRFCASASVTGLITSAIAASSPPRFLSSLLKNRRRLGLAFFSASPSARSSFPASSSLTGVPGPNMAPLDIPRLFEPDPSPVRSGCGSPFGLNLSLSSVSLGACVFGRAAPPQRMAAGSTPRARTPARGATE
mmetsp:Transcript_13691/g.61466  ORF Transcript_13691/g.61466 Transcript_13691/m.61466 type:complete len:373 (-) Transcript_13691:300-1418(-)